MRTSTTLLPSLLLSLAIAPLSAQDPPTAQDAAPEAPAGPRLAPERYEMSFFSFTYGGDAEDVRFSPTQRIPRAKGEAKVEHTGGAAEIQVELDEMKPAWSFGGDFNTYVLWAVSPEGEIDNLGEFVLDGDRSRLSVSTRLDTFGLIVTAEPHFMVDQPSSFVILMNRDPDRSTKLPSQVVRLELTHGGPLYRFERESLENVAKARGGVSSALRQAQVAVQLAEAAGAPSRAAHEFQTARESLYRAEGAAETRSRSDPDVERMARRTVGLAAAAQRLARRRGVEGTD